MAIRAGDCCFWRKRFWMRPILLATYSILSFVAGLGALAAAIDAFQDVRGMAEAEICSGLSRTEAQAGSCLYPVTGRLEGPHYSRGPGSDWDFLEVGQEPSEEQEVQVGTVGSQGLRQVAGGQVTGLLWHGELVAFMVGEEIVESDEYGARPWILRVLAGLALLGGGFMLSNAVGQKRRSGVGWFSVDGGSVGVISLASWRMAAGTVLAMPALLAILPLAFGLPTWTIATTFLIATVFAISVAVFKGPRRGSRHRGDAHPLPSARNRRQSR